MSYVIHPHPETANLLTFQHTRKIVLHQDFWHYAKAHFVTGIKSAWGPYKTDWWAVCPSPLHHNFQVIIQHLPSCKQKCALKITHVTDHRIHQSSEELFAFRSHFTLLDLFNTATNVLWCCCCKVRVFLTRTPNATILRIHSTVNMLVNPMFM